MKLSKWQNRLRLQALDSMRPIQLATLAQLLRRRSPCTFRHLQGLVLAPASRYHQVLVLRPGLVMVSVYKRHTELPSEQALGVLGQNVADTQGKVMGRLVDILVTAEGLPEAAVIDFGGFMGVGTRKIAVRWSALHFAPADKKQPITLELTPDQIKAAPEYNITKPAPVVVAPPGQSVSAVPKAPPSPQ